MQIVKPYLPILKEKAKKIDRGLLGYSLAAPTE
jgi:hypothetical protein